MLNLSDIAIDYMINALCNLSCPFCYGPVLDYKNELSTKMKLILIDSLILHGINFVIISGGEPLLCDDLEEFCRTSYQNGLRIGIQTNGYYIEKLKAILHLLDWVALPLDGIANLSQIKMRTSSKHFFKFSDSISLAIDYKNNNNKALKIKIGTVVSKYNIHELEDMASILSNKNIDVWKLYRIRKRGKGKEVFEAYQVPDKVVLQQLDKIKNRFESLNIYYSSDDIAHDSYIIIDPDSTSYVINGNKENCFGKLFTETEVFDEEVWERIIKYTNLQMNTNNIKHSFPGWIN